MARGLLSITNSDNWGETAVGISVGKEMNV